MHQWLINVNIQNAKRAPLLHTNPAEKKSGLVQKLEDRLYVKN